jgi:hypothetical protein
MSCYYDDMMLDKSDDAAVSSETGAARTGPRRMSTKAFKNLTIILGLLAVALTSLILVARSGKSRDAARRELEIKSIPYTEQELVNRVRHRDLEITKLFLAAGINPDARDEEGATVLQAVQAGDMGIIEALLNNGADVNAHDAKGSSALYLAILIGDNESARILVRKGADVNASNNEGETPLMIAALKGYPDNVKLLLDAGANLNAKDKRGETPLMHAIERNHSEVIQMLKDAGAKE